MLEIKFVRNTNSFGINRKIHQVGLELKYSYIGGIELKYSYIGGFEK